MREASNLGWPDTPFGADKRPWPRTVHLIAACAVCWADDGHRAVPAATALVYVPVRRHGRRQVDAATLHIGFRTAVLDADTEAPAMATLIDGHLVQARRHAAVIAAHHFADDAAALRTVAAGRTPGITSVAEAWADRDRPERGLALLVDTAPQPDTALAQSCAEHAITATHGPGGLLTQGEIQDLYDRLQRDAEEPLDRMARQTAQQTLAVGALTQALVVALMAGRQADRLAWEPTFDATQVVTAVAWDALNRVLATDPAHTATG